MKTKFLDELTAPKKADPKAVRKKQMRSKNINMKIVISAFSALIVLLGAVSAVTVKSEKSKSASTTASNETVNNTSDTLLSATTSENSSLLCNILLAFTREDNNDLKLLAVVSCNAKEEIIKIKYIPVNTHVEVNNYDGTMEEHLESGGITELLWAVGQYCKTSLERYLYCDEEDFCEIMKKLGEIEIEIEEEISHDYNGINFIIEKGKHNLTADMMLKYFVYLCDTSSEEELTNLFSTVASKIISADTQDALNTNYSKIINNVQTDISAMDIAKYLSDILMLARSGSIDNIEICE